MSGRTFVFGSSGFLFRSNKLMYDRQTQSLWHHLTGEPVVGPLADSGIKLKVKPIVTTTWQEWLRAHPDTLVLDINTGYRRDYTPGRPYGTYFASPETMFPATPRSARLRPKELVFALSLNGQPKAYPLEALAREPVVNDTLGATNLVVVAQATTRTVRAFERGALEFRQGTQATELVETRTGQPWAVEEEALVSRITARRLSRLGGHLAFWFGWYAFYPHTAVYGK